MKKFLALIVGMLLVLSFAAVSFAQMPAGTTSVVAKGDTQVALDGEIGMRGRYFKNLDLVRTEGSNLGNASFYQYHYALGVTATTGKVKGVIELYSGTTGWLNFGGTPGGNSNVTGDGSLYFRQLYLEFPIFGINAKLGHQLGQLGVASFLDFSKEGADAFIFSYPFGKNSVALGTIKVLDNNTSTATATTTYDNDTDIYFATADFDLSGHGVGINVANVRTASNGVGVNNNNLYNVGLTYKGKFGPVGILAALDKQLGDDGLATKTKYTGYHGRVVVNYAPINELTLSAASIYYSGDDGHTSDKAEGFVTYLEDKDYATFVYGYLVRGITNANNPLGTAAYGPGTPAPAGTWFNRIAATYKPMKDLAITGAFINLRGTFKNSTNNDYNGNSKSIGNEVDMLISYDITKNLNYMIQGGYFMPGKTWERSATVKNNASAVAMQHVIMYKF